MRGGTTVEGATPAPAAPRRATGALAVPLATTVAVVTVVASSLVLVRYDPQLIGERAMTPWLSFVELAAAVVMVAGGWAGRAPHPLASTGLAVATAGSLLPLWAALPWLPGPVRAGVLAAAPLTVAGVAQVALGWPGEPSPAPRRRRRPGAPARLQPVRRPGMLPDLRGRRAPARRPGDDAGGGDHRQPADHRRGGRRGSRHPGRQNRSRTPQHHWRRHRRARRARHLGGYAVSGLGGCLGVGVPSRPGALRRGPRRRRGVRHRVPD